VQKIQGARYLGLEAAFTAKEGILNDVFDFTSFALVQQVE